MIYIKTYCYSEHEIEFIDAQLTEANSFIDRFIVYEYNFTHQGEKKPYRLRTLIEKIKQKYPNKIIYRPIDLEELIVKTNDENVIHTFNETIQRSFFFNDPLISLNQEDIIIDVDVDEIIYNSSYPIILKLAKLSPIPIGLRLNQFFYKTNYLWLNKYIKAPSIYSVRSLKNKSNHLYDFFKTPHVRDLFIHYPFPVGAHLSWCMSPEMMIRKLNSYAHTKYKKYAQLNLLKDAIRNKEYIFDKNVKFHIAELSQKDIRIPKYFRNK